jgi:DNA-binding beta-propeller fold protein YncE
MRLTERRPASATVNDAGMRAGCQSVTGLPSTAAIGSAPGATLVAVAGRQRAKSSVGVRSGRRGDQIWDLQHGDGGVWASGHSTGLVYRIDRASGRVVRRIQVGGTLSGLAVAPGGVWVADQSGNRAVRIDPATNRVAGRISTRPGPVWFGGSLWVPTAGGRMWRVNVGDPHRVTESRWPRGIFVAQPALGSLWLLDFAGRRTWRIAG